MLRRVVIYHRGAGTAAVGRLCALAGEHGWAVVGTFSDSGQARGPQWTALWRKITEGGADLLAVASFAAIADSVPEALDEVLRLREAGCDLYVDDAGLDTTSPIDRVLFRVVEALKRVDTGATRRRPRSARLVRAKPTALSRTQTSLGNPVQARVPPTMIIRLVPGS